MKKVIKLLIQFLARELVLTAEFWQVS